MVSSKQTMLNLTFRCSAKSETKNLIGSPMFSKCALIPSPLLVTPHSMDSRLRVTFIFKHPIIKLYLILSAAIPPLSRYAHSAEFALAAEFTLKFVVVVKVANIVVHP